MEWHINDLSLSGQYADPITFKEAVTPLLKVRSRRPDLKDRIYCSRILYGRPITATHDLRQAVLATRDRTYIHLMLTWMTASGPFWDDDRAPNPDDYFHYQDKDVTDQGLGEACRRRLIKVQANAFSFLSSQPAFEHTPISVKHGLPEEPLGAIDIDNWWDAETLEDVTLFRPSNWREMLDYARNKMELLLFADDIYDQLKPSPFHEGISERILELLGVLQTISSEMKDDSSLTANGMEVLQRHFVGDKAWFSDESDPNKRRFENELTFRDPAGDGILFCPWHGKVKFGQFRIHFEWPRPLNQGVIKVVYIGPKITKV